MIQLPLPCLRRNPRGGRVHPIVFLRGAELRDRAAQPRRGLRESDGAAHAAGRVPGSAPPMPGSYGHVTAGSHGSLIAPSSSLAVTTAMQRVCGTAECRARASLQYAPRARAAPMNPVDPSSLEPQQGFFKRLRAKLNRPGSWLSYDLGNLVPGRRIDAQILDELETRLLTADVGVEATQYILEALRTRVARNELGDVQALIDALRAALVEILEPCAKPLRIDRSHRPFVVLVVGVNGAGKTTTIGKLAQRLRGEGHSVMLAAGDTFRAAAIEQLEIWATRAGAAFVSQQAGADPGAVMFDAMQAARARGSSVLLADTAGRLHSQSHLMEELKKVKRVIQRVDASAPHEVLLVLDANQGQNALSQAMQFHAAVGVTGLVLTKLDGTAKGGIVVAIARKLGLPIRFLGIGEGVEDFGEFDARAFAAALVDGAGTTSRA
jgi:fused signal recognition particle receptor